MKAFPKEKFLRDVKDHKVQVLSNHENYRHIRFRKLGDSALWFDLVTWPDYLCITGDMGTYTFRHTKDMFRFFRSDKLEINPDYWREKLESKDIYNSVKTYPRKGYSLEYTTHFLWCLYAIVWGIQKYDEHKERHLHTRDEELALALTICHNLTVRMQGAWIEWQHGKGAEAAMCRIHRDLMRVGNLPRKDEEHATDADEYVGKNYDPEIPIKNNPRILHTKILRWFCSGSTGNGSAWLSSKAMASAVAGIETSNKYHPSYTFDLVLCFSFLKAVPEARNHFDKVAALSDTWARLIERWDELERTFDSETETYDRYKPTSTTSKLLKDIIESRPVAH